jgi:hypothetical protein
MKVTEAIVGPAYCSFNGGIISSAVSGGDIDHKPFDIRCTIG